MTTGGPAFPVVGKMSDGEPYAQHEGMTLRDWFAGQALAGICGATQNWVDADGKDITGEDQIARLAYATADAMLAAREKATTR